LLFYEKYETRLRDSVVGKERVGINEKNIMVMLLKKLILLIFQKR
jgi:hypothetical protein